MLTAFQEVEDNLAALRAIHAGLVSTDETVPAVLDMTPPSGRGE